MFAIAILAVVGSHSAYSGEGGSSSYLPGILDVGAGIQPPPGLYFKDYLFSYRGNTSRVEEEGQIETRLHVDSFVSLSLFYNVSKTKIWHSYYGSGLIVTMVDNKLSGQVVKPSGTSAFDASRGALGSVVISPLILGWHNGRSHQRLIFVVYTPLGSYDLDRLLNTGQNRWAVEFDYGFTFLDDKTQREFSVASGYTINFINPATNYRSGQEFHADFAAVQRFPTSLGVGLGGFAYVQTTPDSGIGAKLGSFEGRAYALGPIVVYDAKIGSEVINLTGKYYQEFAVKNRFKGHQYWLNIAMSF